MIAAERWCGRAKRARSVFAIAFVMTAAGAVGAPTAEASTANVVSATPGDTFTRSEPSIVHEVGMLANEASATAVRDGGTYNLVAPRAQSTTTKEVVTTQFEEHVDGGRLEVSLQIDATPTAPGILVSRSARVNFGVDACPDASGRTDGKGTLVLQETRASGSGAKSPTTTVNVVTKGRVGDDAALLKVTIDIGGKLDSDGNAPDGSQDATWQSDGALDYGGKNAGPTPTFDPPGIAGQSDGPFSLSNVKSEASFQNHLVRKLVEDVYRSAEYYWRHDVCVTVEVRPPSKKVAPMQKFKVTGKAMSKIDGADIKRALTAELLKGTTSIDGGNGKSPTTTFAFVGPRSKDKGTVRLTSTSKRRIGKTDVTYSTDTDYKLDFDDSEGDHWAATKCNSAAGEWNVTLERTGGYAPQHGTFTLAGEPEPGSHVDTITSQFVFREAGGAEIDRRFLVSFAAAPANASEKADHPTIEIDKTAQFAVETGDFCKKK